MIFVSFYIEMGPYQGERQKNTLWILTFSSLCLGRHLKYCYNHWSVRLQGSMLNMHDPQVSIQITNIFFYQIYDMVSYMVCQLRYILLYMQFLLTCLKIDNADNLRFYQAGAFRNTWAKITPPPPLPLFQLSTGRCMKSMHRFIPYLQFVPRSPVFPGPISLS